MLVNIQVKVLGLILYDILNDLQEPSNSAESFMHWGYPKLAARGSTMVGLIVSDFSYLIVSCLTSPVWLFPIILSQERWQHPETDGQGRQSEAAELNCPPNTSVLTSDKKVSLQDEIPNPEIANIGWDENRHIGLIQSLMK